ncbi:vesicle transport protein, Use1 [Tanacetum coccineum]
MKTVVVVDILMKTETTVVDVELRVHTSFEENVSKDEEESIILSPGLRRRPVASSAEHKCQDTFESLESSSPVKQNAAAQAHLTKHRKFQEDLIDEMVVLAQQLKQSSLTMNKSIQNTERVSEDGEPVDSSMATDTVTDAFSVLIVFSEEIFGVVDILAHHYLKVY